MHVFAAGVMILTSIVLQWIEFAWKITKT